MRGKISWLIVSSLALLSLVAAACAPAVVEKPEVIEKPKPEVTEKPEVIQPGKNTVTLQLTKRDGTVVEVTKEKPKYGGKLVVSTRSEDQTFFEARVGRHSRETPLSLTHERLLYRDWARGPFGTKEWELDGLQLWPGEAAGWLAESWEVIGDDTAIYHIRKGVNWALNPDSEASRLVGGRQMTAEDVVFTLRNYLWAPGQFVWQGYPYLADMDNLEKSIYVSPDDPWAVVLKSQPGMIGWVWERAQTFTYIFAPEVWEKYGKTGMNDWKRVVGTGAFMLKDYVPGSSLTYERNPNYWQKNPLHPEDQLPYVDTVKVLIIPDKSTRMAALRTGQIDFDVANWEWEDVKQLKNTNPKLVSRPAPDGGPHITMRTDKPPFNDRRVRLALSLAINRPDMIDHLYDGQALIHFYPVVPYAQWSDLFVPLEELPESVREQYDYDPEKAKQLLAEAGYPQGFKTNIYLDSAFADTVAVVKDYWARIGVDLQLEPKEQATMEGIRISRDYPAMTFADSFSPTRAIKMRQHVPGDIMNMSYIDEPWLAEWDQQVNAAYFNPPEYARLIREASLRVLEPIAYIFLPVPYELDLWQPWVKDTSGSGRGIANMIPWAHWKFAWIDQELKREMGY